MQWMRLLPRTQLSLERVVKLIGWKRMLVRTAFPITTKPITMLAAPTMKMSAALAAGTGGDGTCGCLEAMPKRREIVRAHLRKQNPPGDR